MKQIDANDEIFLSKEFLKDKYKFSLISHNLDATNPVIYSDGENYAFVKGNDWNAVWIWTKDNFPKDKMVEIMNILTQYINNSANSITFACKQELYDMLVKFKYEFLPNQEYFISGCYKCFNTIEPKKQCDGYLDKPKITEKDLIVSMWKDNCEESGYPMDIELSLKFADRFISFESFYVWRNDKDEVVAFLDYTIIDNWAEVAHAYTIPSERGKGYMAFSISNYKYYFRKGFNASFIY